nr:hypothetical protein [Pedobacter kyonggii]
MYNRLTLKKIGTKSLKAAIFLFFILSFFLPKLSKGQGIDSTGKFIPLDSNTLYNPKINLKAPILQYDKDAEAEVKKALLEKIDRTIFRIKNDSTNLKSSYVEIWEQKFIDGYLTDLDLLSKYLKSGTLTQKSLSYLPEISKINTLIKPNPFTIQLGNDKTGRKEFILYKYDRLAQYLLENYKKDYDTDEWIKTAEINAEYLDNWRKLEKWYSLTGILDKKIDVAEQNIFGYDQGEISAIKKEVDGITPKKLPLTKWIDTALFVKKWLWFNEGNIRINPLPSTLKEKRYPNDEPNLFFGLAQKKLQDSLEKLKAYDVFRTTKKAFNKIILPVKIPERRPDTMMIQYNMLENELVRVKERKNEFKNGYVQNGLQLVVPIHNIPANKTILLTPEKKDLKYESRAISEINTIAEKIGVITSLGLSNSATIGKITELLNPDRLPDIKYNIPSKTKDDSVNFAAKLKNYDRLTMSSSISTLSGIPKQPVTAIEIEGILIPLTNKDLKEDKKRILWTSQFGKENIDELKDISPLFEKLLEGFVNSDQYFFLDYSSLSAIEPGIDKMMGRFNAFKEKIRKRAAELNELKELNINKNRTLIAYLRISHRSLPPGHLAEKTDTTAMYYSKIFVPEMPAAPQKLSYTLTEATIGSTKLKEVARSDFKLVKTQRFDLSVGIGYTFSDYNITSNTSSDLPTTELGDKFQFQAGLHLYFINRLNKLNDKLLKNTDERFSLYVGLSLKKALENYYTGISYDIVPGVKLIAGAHFYKNNRFKIINNAVAEKASGISYAGLFTSFNLEPVTIGKAIGLFK